MNYPLSQNLNLKNNDVAEYDRYIDLNKLSDLDLENVNILDLNNQNDDNYFIDYIYTVRDGGYTNTYMPSEKMKEFLKEGINYDNYSEGLFRGSQRIMPNKYKWAENIFGNGSNREKTEEAITIEELYGITAFSILISSTNPTA